MGMRITSGDVTFGDVRIWRFEHLSYYILEDAIEWLGGTGA